MLKNSVWNIQMPNLEWRSPFLFFIFIKQKGHYFLFAIFESSKLCCRGNLLTYFEFTEILSQKHVMFIKKGQNLTLFALT